MSTQTTDAPQKGMNRLGLALQDYRGSESTLCAGCGHDAITASIIKACHEFDIQPHTVAKLSGIGCSSKTTNYFLDNAHGFNGVHGRMACIATGAHVANRQLHNIGVSGDGDTASIGLGNFLHMVRRNVPIVYIIENNGCYGLTKGQFSATADTGSVKKGGKTVNQMPPVDICALAIEMGCAFVARSFSGDTNQVRALLMAAMAHEGTAVLDIISPCVTFNNHEGSTKSVTYARQHEDPLHEIDFIPHYTPITVEYDPGQTIVVEMHDGSHVTLKKLHGDHDPRNKDAALKLLHEVQRTQHFYTGLIYHQPAAPSFADQQRLVDEPLATLSTERTRPTRADFDEIMASYK